jgi:glucose/arabinose dehydrogenase
MSARFDVFRLQKGRSVFWVGAANELAEVKRIVFEQPAEDGSMLTVFDQQTGRVLKMSPGELQQLNEIS